MRIDRLFHVLVLGGAAMTAGACGDDTSDDDPEGTSGSGASGSSAQNGSGPSTSAQASGAGGSSTASGAGGTSSQGGAGGGGLECSERPSPSDPCGCACCWAENCLNTDPVCCKGWCEETCC